MSDKHIFFMKYCEYYSYELQQEICTYAQSDQSLCYLLEYSMTLRPLTEHHLEFLSLKGTATLMISIFYQIELYEP